MPIDPTLNVRELVAAESRYRDAMRVADDRYHSAMLKAEIRRQDNLHAQRAVFDRSQADMLRLQVEGNATLVSAQLDRITTALGERIAKLEQFRYESSGKGSGMATIAAYVLSFVGIAVSVAVALVKVT